MSTRLDHVVLGVADLSSGRAEMAGSGLHFVPGGRHPSGTHNALLVSAARWSYVELISAAGNPSDGEHAEVDPEVRRGGLVTYALSVEDLDTAVGRLTDAEYPCSPIQSGSRLTTDGRTVKWRSAMLGSGFGQSELPFLIQWQTAQPHRTGLTPNEDAAALTDIEIGTSRPDHVRRFLTILGLQVRPVGDGLVCSDGDVTMRFLPGSARMSLVCLERSDSTRVAITDRSEMRRIRVCVDAAEGVG